MDHPQGHTLSASRRNAMLALVALLVAVGLAAPPVGSISVPSGDLTSVIIREAPGAADEPEALVRSFGGEIGRRLDLIGGFEAQVPSDSFATLEASRHITTVTPNARLQLSEAGWGDAVDYSATRSPGDLFEVARRTSATSMWAAGYTGAGVDIALIDSGVLPVSGLDDEDKVVNGPDLSFESQFDSLRYLDTAGHGTHLASIMAGFIGHTGDLDDGEYGDGGFSGIAPGARVVSLKVADAHGATDVSQVIAAVDWVVQHKNSNGLNIRVLNLSFGTDSAQSYVLDPLAHAVEQAWHNGIVVVVSAGNDGNAFDLRNPARDPFVIAVGAAEQGGTVGFADDTVADFSNCGTAQRHVDVLAPGRSIMGLRAPGTYADAEHPEARVGDRLFLGSGTSQAAAVVSGTVALMLDANPTLTPDQVKASLVLTARDVAAKPLCQGGGVVNVFMAAKTLIKAEQTHRRSTGTGLLEAARGTDHLSADGVVLEGEIDIFGNAFESAKWAKHARDLKSWKDGVWNGATWSGSTWSGNDWSGATWSAATWSGLSWSGATWSGATWSGATWSGATWSGATWSGATWSGATWSGATWSGATWSGGAWLGFTWT